jgi:pimeloyl-ACP methyl ester carboxylesterase
MIEIGEGRRLHAVRAGPASDTGPVVLLEAGAFGFSVDWSVVQERLAAAEVRSIAYDRAGLGLSDPGPAPRDGFAVVRDLEKLLAVMGETGPLVLCGHSMAGLHVRLFAARNRDRVRGVVLIDATTPEAMDSKMVSGMVDQFGGVSRLAAWGARTGLLRPLAKASFADSIGLGGAAEREKRWAFADAAHNHWAAEEAAQWPAAARQAREAGKFDPALPVAVVLAGQPAGNEAWRLLHTAPARASRRGYIDQVAGANHASLLGPRHADAIVHAIEHVRSAPTQSTECSSAPD